jgi:hypothetical protein
MMGKISKMRQTIVHISDKNKSSAEERIASVAHKWTGVLEKLKAFNDRVQHQMKKDEVSTLVNFYESLPNSMLFEHKDSCSWVKSNFRCVNVI